MVMIWVFHLLPTQDSSHHQDLWYFTGESPIPNPKPSILHWQIPSGELIHRLYPMTDRHGTAEFAAFTYK